MAVDEVNAAGGIMGQKVVTFARDTKLKPAAAAAAAKELITKEDGETPIEVDDIDEATIQAKMKEIEEEMHEISTKMYEAAAAEMAEQQAAEEDDEDVVEADFEVVDSEEELDD